MQSAYFMRPYEQIVLLTGNEPRGPADPRCVDAHSPMGDGHSRMGIIEPLWS